MDQTDVVVPPIGGGTVIDGQVIAAVLSHVIYFFLSPGLHRALDACSFRSGCRTGPRTGVLSAWGCKAVGRGANRKSHLVRRPCRHGPKRKGKGDVHWLSDDAEQTAIGHIGKLWRGVTHEGHPAQCAGLNFGARIPACLDQQPPGRRANRSHHRERRAFGAPRDDV